jgi:arginyl-tRNA synthetase
MHTEGATLGDFGKAYAFGNDAYENNEDAKKEIVEINKKIYDRSDAHINELYDEGKKVSLAYFETMYKKLGTKFDYYFFESDVADFGKTTVLENIENGVFEKGEGGAVIYKGEKDGLHTRVFINSQGLPTYEAKELGLAKIKYDTFPYDLSIVVTGNEINAYFKVLLSAMKEIFPNLAHTTKHISNGMLRLPTGKMSSRTGNIITAESLLNHISEKLLEKIPAENTQLLNDVSVAAVKYSILRQEIGKDIIFDFDKSISFTGDSGPYLQYTHARCASLLEKGRSEGIEPQNENPITETLAVEKILFQFPNAVLRAAEEHRPHHVANYLHTLASAFNTFYNDVSIVKKDDPSSAYKLFVVNAVKQTLANGLQLLGIQAPERM